MTDHQPATQTQSDPPRTPRHLFRRFLKGFTGGLFTRVAGLFGAAGHIIPPAP